MPSFCLPIFLGGIHISEKNFVIEFEYQGFYEIFDDISTQPQFIIIHEAENAHFPLYFDC